MEDTVKEKLDAHLRYVLECEAISSKGRDEMDEFLKLLTKKIQTEKSKTSQLSNLYNFPITHLADSPFATVIDSMKRKSKNEADQYQTFVENLVNDVAYPFKDSMTEFETRSKEMFKQIKADISNLFAVLNSFTKTKWQYEDSSKELINSLYAYNDFKRQATEASSVFYKNRLFNTLGSKLLVSEDRASECKLINYEINQCIEDYLGRISFFKKEFEALEALRFQSIVDAINRIVIFETSCDMNNKYDTKGMASLVEKLDKDQYLTDLAIEDLETIENIEFKPDNELKHLDVFYDDQEVVDYEKQSTEIREFIDKVFQAKNKTEIDQVMNNHLHTFIEQIKHYRCRDTFVDCFNERLENNN